MSGHGVGKSILRKEDERYMRGRGQFVADFKLLGMKEAAFLRSPLAHDCIRDIQHRRSRRLELVPMRRLRCRGQIVKGHGTLLQPLTAPIVRPRTMCF